MQRMMTTSKLQRRWLLTPLALLVLLALAACSGSSNSTTATSTAPAAVTAPNAAAPTASATAGLHIQVQVDFTGAPTPKAAMQASASVAAGTTGWDAVKAAVGAANVASMDYGGNLGIFITGLYGVMVAGNQFWEFDVNGKSSDVGVSQYIVKDGDVLSFRLASF